MRKTFTVSTFVLDTAAKAGSDGPVREALERRLGEPVASSESSALRQLAEIGARVVTEDAAERGYAQLAEILAGEPDSASVQTLLGGPIDGEDESQFEALFAALNETT